MREELFVNIVACLLEKEGFSEITQSDSWCAHKHGETDLLMSRNGKTYCVETLLGYNPVYSFQSILKTAKKAEAYDPMGQWTPMIVAGGIVDSWISDEICTMFDEIVVLDIRNLLYIAKSDRFLCDELIALLPYSVGELEPQVPVWNSLRIPVGPKFAGGPGESEIETFDNSTPVTDFNDEFAELVKALQGNDHDCYYVDEYGRIHLSPESKVTGNLTEVESCCFADSSESQTEKEPASFDVSANAGTGKSSIIHRGLAWISDYQENQDLRGEVEGWKGGKGISSSGEYEKLCTRVLKRLFAEDLTLWREQANSDAGLFRFDLICKIKRDNRKDFWEVAERYFGSKYIIFEFKNYAGKVTQKEVFTTVRYLYTKALRGIAILISPNGVDDHADKAIRGVLRDEGKLILSLTNDDLLRMLEMQEIGEFPADYLSDKLDELLIDLEK